MEQAILSSFAQDHDVAHHSQHFCMLAASRQIGQIALLSRNPNYICRHCGRVADMEMNICEPIRLNALAPDKPKSPMQRLRYGSTEITYG
ncbi:MAG: hypothetical protein GF401_16735 [Chitinivibrionales bacterium]|nr:hypothetical protein [Chitinivibrionales bacterium]